MNTNNWILTDDDSCQYVKQLSESEFHLIELSLINPKTDEYEVYYDEIDVDDYLDDEREKLISILGGFGYNSIEDVISHYGENANQIMAECIFEHFGSFFGNRVFIGKYDECEKFIKEYLEQN